jgi:hypothetical protein
MRGSSGGTGVALTRPVARVREPRHLEWVARFGSFVTITDWPPERSATDLLDAVVAELKADPRVVSVEEPEIEEDWCTSGVIYPSPLPSGIDSWFHHMHWVRFSAPLSFRVGVPAKNQRRLSEGDELPTSYVVWWDGMVVLTAWQVRADEPLGLSGGHVVEDILSEALERADFELYVQGCNPGCSYGYAHTSLRLLPAVDDQDEIAYEESSFPGEVTALVPRIPRERPGAAFFDLAIPAAGFTTMKNVGRHMLDVEQDARENLDKLLDLVNARAEVSLVGKGSRPKAMWELRHWRRESNRLIAKVWLGLSVIERLQRTWSAERFDFEQATGERGLSRLFVRDHADDKARIESLDLDLMRAAVAQAAERLDRQALTRVTGIAAVAGGVAGAVFGALAGHII